MGGLPCFAESDLLFPQMDSVMFSDFSNFSEYEDFSKDMFLINEIDGIGLLEDLDCKDGLKPLLMSELNDFSSSLEGIKEEDEEEDMAHSAKSHEVLYASKPREDSRGGALQVGAWKIDDGFIAENPILESIMSHTKNNLISPRTSLTTNGLRCMSLEENIVLTHSDKPWHALTPGFEHTTSIDSNGSDTALAHGDISMTSLSLVTQGDMHIQSKEVSIQEKGAGVGTMPKNGIMQLSCTSETSPALSPLQQVMSSVHNQGMMNNIMHADTLRVSIAPSIFHINSPLSSPSSSRSTPDGSSTLKMYAQEENVNMARHTSASVLQPTASVDSGLRSPHTDAYHGGIPCHVVKDVPASFSTMHRSRSSHALGQFRTPAGHLGTCPEEFSVSSMQMPTMGFSRISNFTPYQASCSQGLAERSSSATPMRRVFSTGDIQACNGLQICYGDNNSSRLEHANSEDHLGLKVGHYTLEERKVRLHRYRQKRNERNFSKKIKYACRKTLADSRPRIRGRFARTLDDAGEPLLKENGASYDDEYEEVHVVSAHSSNRNVSFWN